VGDSLRPKNVKKCIKFNWNFQRGRGSWKKSLPWGRYGYYLELNITARENINLRNIVFIFHREARKWLVLRHHE